MTDFSDFGVTCIVMQDSLPASLSVAFLHPFFDELLGLGKKRSELAARIGLNEASLFNPAVSVPANTVYGFLSWSAAETADPLFCARVGQQMTMGGWAPLLPLMVSAKTVGDFFQKFCLMSSEQSQSVIYKLEVEGAVAIWQLLRAKGASDDAFFADAVAAGFFVELLKSAAQDDWEAAKTIAVLPDTSLVPQDLLPSTSVLSGQSGLILRFPSRYLGLDIPVMLLPDDLPTMSVPKMPKQKLVERVHQLISHRIGEPDLGVKGVAKGLGLATWKL